LGDRYGWRFPPERRHGGGLRQFTSGLSQMIRIRLFVGYVLTAALSGFTMMAYVVLARPSATRTR
jgi:hypothetical protein